MNSEMDQCLKCPACNSMPQLTREEKVLGQPGKDWVLRCLHHGHVAQGDTLKMAVKHWNFYIRGAVIHRSAQNFIDHGPSKKDESYCTVCGEYTKSRELPDRIECNAPYCKAVKYWKEPRIKGKAA